MSNQILIVAMVVAFCAVLSVVKSKLNSTGAFAGWIISVLIFISLQWMGIVILSCFFILGTLSTAIGLSTKLKLGLVAKNESRRNAGQVFANGGVATIVALFAFLCPEYKAICSVMFTAAFASSAADTMSSELGNVYGKSFYNITTLRRDTRGLDGVISLEGTLFGIIGAAIIALVYYLFTDSLIESCIIILAGTIGNITDSILGATAERKRIITNDAVNWLNAVSAALVAGCIYVFK